MSNELKNGLYPIIEKNYRVLSGNIIKAKMEYLDKNFEALKTPYPTVRPSWFDKDSLVFYESLGINSAIVSDLIKKSKDIDEKRKVSGNPLYILILTIAAYAISKKDMITASNAMEMMFFRMYSSRHIKYAPKGFNENVMEYTVNTKLDGSVNLIKFGSVYNMIKNQSDTILKTYNNRFVRCGDLDLSVIANASMTAINKKVKNIAIKYYDAKEKGEYLNKTSESYNPEDFNVSNSDYKLISSIVGKVIMDFNNNIIDRSIIKYVLLNSKMNEQKFFNMLYHVRDTTTLKQLQDVCYSMIGYAVTSGNLPAKNIGTGKFLAICESGFKSNTTSESMAIVKGVLEEWVEEYLKFSSGKSLSKSRKNGYKRSLFDFFMYTIYNAAK
jgi:hypothetical protein